MDAAITSWVDARLAAAGIVRTADIERHRERPWARVFRVPPRTDRSGSRPPQPPSWRAERARSRARAVGSSGLDHEFAYAPLEHLLRILPDEGWPAERAADHTLNALTGTAGA